MDNKTYHLYTDEEKLEIIKDHIDNQIPIRACTAKYNVSATSLVYWLRRYREKGKDGLKPMIGKYRGKNKGRPKGTFKPRTSIEALQKENLKLQVEIERLKKGYLTKGVGVKKEFISINNKNFKSLDN